MNPPRLFRIPVLLLVVAALLFGCRAEPKPDLLKIENRVRKILELPTVEYRYKDIVYLGDKKTFLFFTTVDKKLLFSVNIRIRAGLDLRGDPLTLSPDEKKSKKIRVRLPRSGILLIDADEKSIHQYFAVEQGDKFSRLEFSREIERIKPRIEKDARDRGILKQSEENAKRLVRSFLELAGFEEIDFEPSTKG